MKSRKTLFTLCIHLLILTGLSIHAEDNQQQYEGVHFFKNHPIDVRNLAQFLPYNPTIVEAGAYEGSEAAGAAIFWPKCKIFALEPNPRAYETLEKIVHDRQLNNIKTFNIALNSFNGVGLFYLCHGTQGLDPSSEYSSSLLKPSPEKEIDYYGPKIVVPCITLDDWCYQNEIQSIDILKLELEGMELQVLEASTSILKNTKSIYVRTYFNRWREGMTSYRRLFQFLRKSGFVLLSHSFRKGHEGKAIFLSREIYDGYFKHSLGLNLEN